MLIRGVNYRYEAVKTAGSNSQWMVVDHNSDIVLAYGSKKEVFTTVRLLSLGGTYALADALWEARRK